MNDRLLAVAGAAFSWFSGPVFWGIVLVVMAVIEIATLNLVSIWFALAALISLVASLFGASQLVQFVLFIVFSAAGFLVFALILRPRFQRKKTTPTNADRIIGKIGVVVEPVSNLRDSGLIRVEGQMWSARTPEDMELRPGERVRVAAIRGVKAIVEPVQDEAGAPEAHA